MNTPKKQLWTFDEVARSSPSPSAEFGQKAASLLTLYGQGLPVPPGGCIATSALESFIVANGLKSLRDGVLAGAARGDAEWAADCELLSERIQSGRLSDWLVTEIFELVGRHPEARFAVRCSGTQEDRSDSSFAGLYTTVLNVHSLKDIYDAVKTCWASLYHPRVLAYCRLRGVHLEDLGMGVAIQVMIPAEKSGVSFSVNPDVRWRIV